jgi:hypothetical protein
MKPIKSELTQVVLVCGKCAKKVKRGYGPEGDEPFVDALRSEIARRDGMKPAKKLRRKGSSVAVIEVPCLKICPKQAVVTINGREPERWHVLPRGAGFDALLGTGAPVAAE